MLFGAQGLSADIWREVESGALRRTLTTPARISGFLLGKTIAGFLFAGVLGVVGLVAAHTLFGVKVEAFAAAALWAAATGAVEGTAVRVTYKGRELMVTMEPRLGRVGGKELPEFIEEIETVKAHFEARATRAQKILKRISPKIKEVEEIHLRLAAVGLSLGW